MKPEPKTVVNIYLSPQGSEDETKAEPKGRPLTFKTEAGAVLPTLVATGGAIKVLGKTKDGDTRIGGHILLFSDEGSPDLWGDYFTKATHYGPHKTLPLYWQHGFDSKMGTRQIGEMSWDVDEAGLWAEGIMAERDAYSARILQMIEDGELGYSTGAVGHLVRDKMGPTGKAWEITEWVLGEVSLTHTPAEPRTSALVDPKSFAIKTLDNPVSELHGATKAKEDATKAPAPDAAEGNGAHEPKTKPVMTPEELAALSAATDANTKAVEGLASAVTTLVESQTAAAEAAKAAAVKTTAPDVITAPGIITDTSDWKYDAMKADEIAIMCMFLNACADQGLKSASGRRAERPSDQAYRAIGRRLLSSEVKESPHLIPARRAYKKFLWDVQQKNPAFRSDEVMYSTLAGFGDEWIGAAYSGALWESIRTEATLASRFPSFAFPAGSDSFTEPYDTSDPTWYKVAEANDIATNPGTPITHTVPASQRGTAKMTHSLAKLGARVAYSGELVEDALIPFVADLAKSLKVSGAEIVDAAIINGDDTLTGTTNINEIDGTPAATDWYTAWDGLRYNALIANSAANARDGGSLSVDDYLDTMFLMGTVGKHSRNKAKCAFITDPTTHKASLKLAEVKTRDVFTGATVEGGDLKNVWGYEVIVSDQMCLTADNRLSNAAGKVDVGTQGNNTKGSILGVRFDQWKLGTRRAFTVEADRVPQADATELVAMMRLSFTPRDTEASAISYNLTV